MRQKSFSIRPVHDILLRGSLDVQLGLSQLRVATAEQLCRLYYPPGCIKAVKARQKELEDHGYIQHDVIPSREFRKPYYYTLTGKGARYLQSTGMDTDDAFRASREVDKHGLFIDHALELNDMIIAAALLKKGGSGFYLYNFIHEHSLKRHPYKATWRENGHSETHNLIPDALLDFRYSDGQRQLRVPVLLEQDRGTEQQRYFRRRIRAYIAFLEAGAQQDMFGAQVVTIAFSTFAGDFRLAQMRQWAKQELGSRDASIGQSFVFANLSRPPEPHAVWLEPVWQMPFDGEPIALLGAVQ
jgi:Replication-relaxation